MHLIFIIGFVISIIIGKGLQEYLDKNKTLDTDNSEMVYYTNCYWDLRLSKECNLTCDSGRLGMFNEAIEYYWTDRPSCQLTNMSLTVSYIIYPESIIPSNWFTAQVQITNLRMYNEYVMDIMDDAFVAEAFENLKSMTIYDFYITLKSKTFNGLSMLEELNFIDADFNKIDGIIFGSLGESLKTLSISQKTINDSPFNLNDFFDGAKLPALKMLSVKYNLPIIFPINVQMEHIESVDLSDCQISEIVKGAFDLIGKNILSLNLERNKLITLPSNLFLQFLNPEVHVKLDFNPWNCDCNLMYLKNYLHNTSEINKNSIVCETPSTWNDVSIVLADFCPYFENDDNTFDGNVIGHKCYDVIENSTKTIYLKQHVQVTNIWKGIDNDIFIEVDISIAKRFVVIWFNSSSSEEVNEFYEAIEADIGCQSSNTTVYRIGNLYFDTTYTICLIEKTEETVSPLNCMPYVLDSDEYYHDTMWIGEEDKVKTIGLVVFGIFVNIIFGLILSIVLIRKNPTWLKGNKRIVRVSNAATGITNVVIMPSEWSKQRCSTSSSINKSDTSNQNRRHSDTESVSSISKRLSIEVPSNSNGQLVNRKSTTSVRPQYAEKSVYSMSDKVLANENLYSTHKYQYPLHTIESLDDNTENYYSDVNNKQI